MFSYVLLLCFLNCLGAKDGARLYDKSTETIVFLRHAEKPVKGLGQITCQGYNRALALPKLLKSKFGTPDYIFAPAATLVPEHHTHYYYVRGVATIEPTAIHFGLPINMQYAAFEPDGISKELLKPKYREALIFISWEHINITRIIQKILASLGINGLHIPPWDSEDYDKLYVLSIDWHNHPPKASFEMYHEGLNGLHTIC